MRSPRFGGGRRGQISPLDLPVQRLRVALGEHRRHVELAGLEVITAFPVGQSLHGDVLRMLVHFARQRDQEVAIVGPVNTEPAISIFGALHQIGRDVVVELHVLRVRPAVEIGPGEVTERLLRRAHEGAVLDMVEKQILLARAGLLHPHQPLRVAGEAEAGPVALLGLQLRHPLAVPRPGLPFDVEILAVLHVLLDPGGAVGRGEGEIGIVGEDVVRRRARGGKCGGGGEHHGKRQPWRGAAECSHGKNPQKIGRDAASII
ncbi:bll0363 [Bradyrhizobium diazoefficiens USDA 110]|uniref:Bll0363 protein n=1 Tax=Bradyrhizobium diazoefficiens (strain JCM 10833 / BCRC 13528 / IAM 13628 / NBRC 14792 / USDA 110) TaxID=224911 RepID=Q89XF1_BRADU|nr:hypothetical protein CO678_15690 [Bradyrhizobium diazoefficiens]QBP26916.1 hypothetical protein Bdiaspc4_01475 [Bradyrhizobium diazoefficiens]BAC45628.1 bll0363 [Bradyrhizobium diazoefficiens USDA 110]